MTRYSTKAADTTKSAISRGSDLRVHFKNTRETAAAIKGKTLNAAKQYYEAVLRHERCIPFRRFSGGVGRTAQAKNEGSSTDQGRWPVKSVEFLLGLLKNAESNAEARSSSGAARRPCAARADPRRGSALPPSCCSQVKGLDTENLVVSHIQVNQAMKQRRRTYRAHGRINRARPPARLRRGRGGLEGGASTCTAPPPPQPSPCAPSGGRQQPLPGRGCRDGRPPPLSMAQARVCAGCGSRPRAPGAREARRRTRRGGRTL